MDKELYENDNQLSQYSILLTAGRAKKDMAKTEKHEATILPIHASITTFCYLSNLSFLCDNQDQQRMELSLKPPKLKIDKTPIPVFEGPDPNCHEANF